MVVLCKSVLMLWQVCSVREVHLLPASLARLVSTPAADQAHFLLLLLFLSSFCCTFLVSRLLLIDFSKCSTL